MSRSDNLVICFDVQEQYYIPQYLSIAQQLSLRGIQVIYVSHDSEFNSFGSEKVMCIPEGENQVDFYNRLSPDWIIIGNTFQGIEKLDNSIKTALVSHGIGPKACYYTVSDTPTTVRFVEGPYRLKRLKEMYPNQKFIDTRYAKLDAAVNGEYSGLKPSDYGLDDNKKTVLYAPAFFPSSIENFSSQFPEDFSEYNILLKPHFFSLSSPKYKKQKEMLENWALSPNVYFAKKEDVNLVPFMAIADVLISDASSALFEFAALDKPVVWCDFYYLRWSYRGPFKFRFRGRMDKDLYEYSDIAKHVGSYQDLKSAVESQLDNPMEYSEIRKRYTLNLSGVVDGKASQRIADYLLQNCSAP